MVSLAAKDQRLLLLVAKNAVALLRTLVVFQIRRSKRNRFDGASSSSSSASRESICLSCDGKVDLDTPLQQSHLSILRMHPCLKPELRAAQRVLRVIRQPYRSSPRIVVRSFASFSRLREAATPATDGNPSNDRITSARLKEIEDIRQQFPKRLQPLPNTIEQKLDNFYHSELLEKTENITWERQSISDLPLPIPEYGEGFEGLYNALQKFRAELDQIDKLDHWESRAIRRSRDRHNIHSWLQNGNVPAEHRIIEKLDDVPLHLREYIGKSDSPYATQLPCLYSDDPMRLAHWHPISAKLQQTSEQEIDGDTLKGFLERNRIIERVKAMEAKTEDQSASSKASGSGGRRRRRQRDSKVAQFSTPIPQWFLDGNITYANQSEPRKTGIIPAPSSESQIGTASAAEDAQVQIMPQEKVTEPTPEPRLTTYGKGRSGPSPDDETNGGSGPSKVPTSTIVNTKTLGNGRYFVDEAQYEELFNTFKGRLQSPSTDSDSQNKVYDALNHLTILHGARDSELLLDALVQDMCNAVDANRIHLDAQDIAEFVAQAEKGKHNVSRAARISWKLYKSLYGADEYQESAFPKQDEEENEDEENEEDNESTSIELPIGSMFPNLGGAMSDAFKRFGQSRRGGGMLGMSPIAVISPMGGSTNAFSSGNVLDTSVSYAPTANAILSSVFDAHHAIPHSNSESAKEQETPTPKPLIVHVENYKLLQENQYSESFLASLVEAADDRRASGQTVMIVGTDSLRDFPKSSDPRSILENQANKSYGVSTAIVLTPVLPDRNAELALIEDRSTRIRDINVRHLQQVLRSRGQLFHGLEDGFWKDDYREAIGQRDYDVLSSQFWSYIHVQRIAAVMAGVQSDAPLEDACSIISTSDESKVAWAQRNQPDIHKQEKKDESRSEDRQLRSIRAKASRHEKKLLSGVIESKKIQTTFEDIHIPVETTDALKMLTTLSLQRPEAFRYGVLKSDRIPGLLLYGPPGTGKTLAAKAVAKESGATMLEVSAADLNDMYVGEGEKNVQALFSLAKKLSPCVVFLDEADAMFSARSTSRRASHRELLNQFLKEWDGMSNDSGSAFIMVATNRPMDLDDAVLRRLPRRILVDLPTEADRLSILRIHLRNEDLDSTVNLEDLAKRTPFYSGSDLKNVAVAAALNAVRDENDAAAKFRLEKPDEKHEYPARRILTQKHFDKALEEITASISQDMSSLREIKKFDEQYGDKKGRKRKSPKWGFKSASEADKVLDTVKVRS